MVRSRFIAPRCCRMKARTLPFNQRYAERLLKFLLWQKGGYRVTIGGDPRIAEYLRARLLARRRARLRLEIHRRARLRPASHHRNRGLRHHSRGKRNGRAAGPPSGGLPHRLRPGRERPQMRRGGSTARWSSATKCRGTRACRPIRNITSTASTIRCGAPPTHLPRVDAIGGSAAGVYVEQRSARRVAVPRRAAAAVRHPRPAPVLRAAEPPGAAFRSRW